MLAEHCTQVKVKSRILDNTARIGKLCVDYIICEYDIATEEWNFCEHEAAQFD
jgi:hypothetical protein